MPTDVILWILGGLILISAVMSLALRNLIHCALFLMVCFLGLAGLYLHLNAVFSGLVQALVYVGAVGIILIFAILLTEGGGTETGSHLGSQWRTGIGLAVLLAFALLGAVSNSPQTTQAARHTEEPTVREIGLKLMTDYLLPLQTIGLLLTAAAIGAVVLAMQEPKPRKDETP